MRLSMARLTSSTASNRAYISNKDSDHLVAVFFVCIPYLQITRYNYHNKLLYCYGLQYESEDCEHRE